MKQDTVQPFRAAPFSSTMLLWTSMLMAVDNSAIVDTGLVRSGEQRCMVEFTSGTFKGQTATAINLLLTTLIIALVYGFDRRCAAAVSGSFGLVSVAPFTALCAGFLLTKK